MAEKLIRASQVDLSEIEEEISEKYEELTRDIDDLADVVEEDFTTLNNRITEVASELEQTIEENVVALQNEDNALQNQINAHSQTLTAYDTRITNNTNAITKEVSDRQQADSDLQSDIATETQERKSADDTLQDQIDTLSARGRFLSLWDATTGLAESTPQISPYIYKTGDYFIVDKVGETNYRPTGTEYVIGQASTELETEELATDDVYYFDGATWHLQINHGKTVSFANLAGQPSDNTALKNALDGKQNNLTAGVGISINNNTVSNTYTSLDKYTSFSGSPLNAEQSFIYKSTSGDYLRGNFGNFLSSFITPTYATKTELSTGLSEKQNTISDLSTIRTNAQAGKGASDTISGYGDIVTHNASEFQPTGDYATKTELTQGLATKQPVGDYATNTDVVHKTGEETIDGTKTFTGKPIFTQTSESGALTVKRSNGANYASISYQNTAGTLGTIGFSNTGKPYAKEGEIFYKLVKADGRTGNIGTSSVGSSTNPVYIDGNGNATAITSYSGTSSRAIGDSNGLNISNNYMKRNYQGSVTYTSEPVPAYQYGTSAKPIAYFANVNLLHTVKNYFYKANKNLYNNGTVSITCNYDDVVADLGIKMVDGSYSGYYTNINPSTNFSVKPFVFEILSTQTFEVTDVCNLFIVGHRLGHAIYATKYKIEVASKIENSVPNWTTLIDYEGSSVELGSRHFSLYSPNISTSPAYHNVLGVRLTINGSTDTVFQMSEIMLLSSRGTEPVADGFHALDVGIGGKVVGDITIPTDKGSFVGYLSGTATRAYRDGYDNLITTTYATKTELGDKQDILNITLLEGATI